jgi:uncharacterized protein (DUF58 family)
MMLFMGLAAINSQANLLFGMFGLMIGILLVSGVISRVVLRKLRVHREVPDHGEVGRPMSVTYEFRNDKRFWPSLSVSLAELDGVEGFTKQPQAYLLHSAAGMAASVATEVVPKRRGVHEFDRYQLGTSFPFGFVKRAVGNCRRDSVLILPAMAQVSPKVLAMCRSAEKTGASMRPRPGGTDEFYGVKEFRNGDNPRLIYWRRSARTGVLVSKEMTQVSPPRILIAVDTFLADRSLERHVRVERVIAMAGSLAAHALDEGMSVGLCAWNGEWVGMMPDRGKRHRDDLLSVLARLTLNVTQDTPGLTERMGDFLRPGTTPVLFTGRDVQVGLSERTRGSMLIVSAISPQADAWFRFGPEVDFATCMPADQQPKMMSPSTAGGR